MNLWGGILVNIIPIRSEFEWTALEFFAGIGLARAGMEQAGIKTVWANDYDLN
ncbi:DNA cytosine methyltransferase, partial [Salmonella enterica]